MEIVFPISNLFNNTSGKVYPIGQRMVYKAYQSEDCSLDCKQSKVSQKNDPKLSSTRE